MHPIFKELFVECYGPTAMIHRADLLAVLRAALSGEVLRPGTTVTTVRADGTVRHSGGESRADLVVGANGMRSITRRSLWPGAPAPRYAGYTAWRLVTPLLPAGEAAESWGRGERFGYAPLKDTQMLNVHTQPELSWWGRGLAHPELIDIQPDSTPPRGRLCEICQRPPHRIALRRRRRPLDAIAVAVLPPGQEMARS